MRDKLDNPLPETTQAPPASPIFDPRYCVPLTRAFGQFMSIIEARDHSLICINRYVHEGPLRLVLVAPDGMKWEPDASERQKLTVHAPHNFEEGVRIEPYHEGRWYVYRCDLAKLTAIPSRLVPRPGKRNRRRLASSRMKLTVADPTPHPEIRSARPPSDEKLNGFVAGFIEKTTDAKRLPTKTGLYEAARDALPGATRKRLFDAFELQAETLPPGRPRKNRR
jgi:hypothetical protein